jgi:sugar lactone lactonase YvrE
VRRRFRSVDVLVEVLTKAVAPDSKSSVAALGLGVPNGIPVSHDGTRLVVAETRARRRMEFRIGDNGTLGHRHAFDECPRAYPGRDRARY